MSYFNVRQKTGASSLMFFDAALLNIPRFLYAIIQSRPIFTWRNFYKAQICKRGLKNDSCLYLYTHNYIEIFEQA